jgi:hypothetical protein
MLDMYDYKYDVHHDTHVLYQPLYPQYRKGIRGAFRVLP